MSGQRADVNALIWLHRCLQVACSSSPATIVAQHLVWDVSWNIMISDQHPLQEALCSASAADQAWQLSAIKGATAVNSTDAANMLGHPQVMLLSWHAACALPMSLHRGLDAWRQLQRQVLACHGPAAPQRVMYIFGFLCNLSAWALIEQLCAGCRCAAGLLLIWTAAKTGTSPHASAIPCFASGSNLLYGCFRTKVKADHSCHGWCCHDFVQRAACCAGRVYRVLQART